nr:CoA transferase [Arthrobacter sp. EpRS71]
MNRPRTFATRQLADLGARVIKVERPGAGDLARGYDTTVKGLGSLLSGSTEARRYDRCPPNLRNNVGEVRRVKNDYYIVPPRRSASSRCHGCSHETGHPRRN